MSFGVPLADGLTCAPGQAEHLFTPEQYQTTLVWLLKSCVVNTKELHQVRAHCLAAQEERKTNLKLSRITVLKGRVRLRDRVSTVYKTEERQAQVDALLDTWDSFTGFCYRHQFPVTLSTKLKSLLYFLASQTRWPWQDHLARVLPAGGPLLLKVASHPVTQPVRSVVCLFAVRGPDSRLCMGAGHGRALRRDLRADDGGERALPVAHGLPDLVLQGLPGHARPEAHALSGILAPMQGYARA